jgi:hypothetical protein
MTEGPTHAQTPGRAEEAQKAFKAASCRTEISDGRDAWGVTTIIRDVLVGMFDERLQRRRKEAVVDFCKSETGQGVLATCVKNYGSSRRKEIPEGINFKDIFGNADVQQSGHALNSSDKQVKQESDLVEVLVMCLRAPSPAETGLEIADWKVILAQLLSTEEVKNKVSTGEVCAKREHSDFASYIKDIFDEALTRRGSDYDVGSLDPHNDLSVARVLRNLVESSDGTVWKPTEFLADEFRFFLNEDTP